MSTVTVQGSTLGNELETLLTAPEITPGDAPSYQLCRTIYLYHPLGNKLAEAPIKKAQSQDRIISVPDSPEDDVKKRFKDQWEEDRVDEKIAACMTWARVYGIASLALVCEEVPPQKPIDLDKIADLDIAFSVFDPLNTSGSLVLNQLPNAVDFQKVNGISVDGIQYHRSRTVTMMNERPIYLGYTSSAFGFVGRSVYQRILFPLKSFVQSMQTDDMISRKAGLLIAKQQGAGSIVDNLMAKFAGLKRAMLKAGVTGQVLSIGVDEEIQSLDLQNIDKAGAFARTNILKNIATGADMPAVLIENETLTEGFGEGTEDAKIIAGYVAAFRKEMSPLYRFMDRIIMRRAWNQDFYATIQNRFPNYRRITYDQAFYQWANSFSAMWPNLLEEPDSEKVKVDKVKLEAIVAMLEVLLPTLDPENKAAAIEWAQDNFNELKMLFGNPLELDFVALSEYEPPQFQMGDEGQGDGKPPVRQDAERLQSGFHKARAALDRMGSGIIRLPAGDSRRQVG